jgi:molecular chaperone DnaK
MADTLVYTAEKTLREQGDKVPAQLKSEVDSKIAAVKSALTGGDVQQLKRTTQELSDAMQKVGAAVYQQQAGAGPGAPPPPPGGEEGPGKKDEGTVEGEFREV